MKTPVACTLTKEDLESQRERWIQVCAEAGTARVETEDGLRLVFADKPGVADELNALAAVENECCSWARWTVLRRGQTLFMEARSRREGIAALHGMFIDRIPAQP
jgi:hypothetical protein